jgi:hypothetical protein
MLELEPFQKSYPDDSGKPQKDQDLHYDEDLPASVSISHGRLRLQRFQPILLIRSVFLLRLNHLLDVEDGLIESVDLTT